MSGPHDIDEFWFFCRKCGSALQSIVERQQHECPATANVVGISHVVRPRQLKTLAEKILSGDPQ